jgi:hypothetical protein
MHDVAMVRVDNKYVSAFFFAFHFASLPSRNNLRADCPCSICRSGSDISTILRNKMR